VPAGVELATAVHLDTGHALLEDGDLLEGLLELALRTDDADQRLHALLEIGMDGVGILPARALEGRQQLAEGRLHRALVHRHRALEALDVLGGGGPARRPNTMRSESEFPRADWRRACPPPPRPPRRAGHAGGGGVGVHPDAAIDVVAGRSTSMGSLVMSTSASSLNW